MKKNHMIDEVDILGFGKSKPKKPGLIEWLAFVIFVVVFGIMLTAFGFELMQWELVNIDSMHVWVRK